MQIQLLDQLVPTLEPYFTEKAPVQLPKNWKEGIVKYAHYVILIISILVALPLIALILGGTFMALFAWTSLGGILSLLATILTIISVIFYMMSYSGIKERAERGWRLVFYSSVISAASSVVSWLSNPVWVNELLGAALGLAISLFILFQIRDYYTGKAKVDDQPVTDQKAEA